MALYELQPYQQVPRVQVFKGGISPRIEPQVVKIPRQLIFPQRHLSFLRRYSAGDLHMAITQAVRAGIIKTQNLKPDQQKKWIEEGNVWLLEEEARYGKEGFELHLDNETNNQAMYRSESMSFPTNKFMVITTAPKRIFSFLF